MATLTHDWLTQGWIDFEYKQYILLSYLQEVTGNFNANKLFPDLSNLQTHHDATLQLREAKNQIAGAFQKKIKGIDVQKAQIVREDFIESDYMSEINGILDYALPLFQKTLCEGKNKFNDIEALLTFAPVGIVPLRSQEGYLFIYRSRRSETDVYHYQIRLFESHLHRNVQTTYIETVQKSVSVTFENMKLTLIQKRRGLPNPATYLVETPVDYPVQETLLPIAKQLIVKHTQ